MKLISLFSGIGGFELAAEWAGWQNVVSCEINPFGRQVLKHYWPNAYHHDDIKTLTFEKIDYELKQRFGENWNADDIVLTGGFPCQPYSAAGKRLGKEDERHLWPEMLRVIREVQPKWVVGENVLGLVNWSEGLVFEEVQADLESEGYEVQPYVLPAAGVNAPHKRDRVWFVAYANGSNDGRITRKYEIESREERLSKRNEVRKPIEPSKVFRNTANTQLYGHLTTERRCCNGEDCQWCEKGQNCTKQPPGVCQSEKLGGLSNAADTDSANNKAQPQKRVLGQADKRRKAGRFVNGYTRTQWDDFPTQPPIRSRDDGLFPELVGITVSKHRNESIKAYGNAIVPQVVYQIFKSINEYQTKTT